MDQCIDSTAWQFAKEMIPKGKPNVANNKAPNPNSTRNCTTYNTFRKEGCSFEHNNPGETCIYAHICSKCKTKGHKGIYCPNPNKQNVSPATTASTVPATTTSVVVTSV